MNSDKENGKMLMAWERKILRYIYGPTKENGQWRIKSNDELMAKYKAPDIVNVIKIRKLNKQPRTADEGWSSSLGVGRGANNPSP